MEDVSELQPHTGSETRSVTWCLCLAARGNVVSAPGKCRRALFIAVAVKTQVLRTMVLVCLCAKLVLVSTR